MTARAVALLSGGLDSMLAIRAMQEQGVEVHALNFQTIFTCCRDNAAQAAQELGVPLTVIGQEDDYIELIRKPKYGYGKGANPCVDCRIYMFERSRRFADELGASTVVSGEVLGQRPKSQKRRDLLLIAEQAGLRDRLLRPLSALLLPPTLAERNGEIDRNRLYSFCGRGRKPLIALARHFGFRTIPSPSTGCSLTETTFSGKVHDLVRLDPQSQRWDFELLNVGRHLRIDRQTKAVVGRRELENETLERMYEATESRASLLMAPKNFRGPTLLVIGPVTDATIDFAGGLVLRYAGDFEPDNAVVRLRAAGAEREMQISPHDAAEAIATL